MSAKIGLRKSHQQVFNLKLNVFSPLSSRSHVHISTEKDLKLGFKSKLFGILR